MLRSTFYVTTQEIEHPEREHNYRLAQGEALPEDQSLKTQRPAGQFKLAELFHFKAEQFH